MGTEPLERKVALRDVQYSVLPPVRRSEAVMPPSRVCGFLDRGAAIARALWQYLGTLAARPFPVTRNLGHRK
ncbi:MAG: hypothetical protein V3W33_00790 [Gammaproteobacteria bacterium]